MPFTYDEVTIASHPYSVYGDQTDADIYLQASASASAWQALTAGVNETKSKYLVSATRWLNSVAWKGAKTDDTNELPFPRTGLTYPDGSVVDSATIPELLKDAEFELAALIAEDPTIQSTFQDPKPRSLTAGSVSITNFRPVGEAFGAAGVQVVTPFPPNVMALIGFWLSGSGANVGARVNDVCDRSQLERPHDFIHGF